MEVKNVMTRDVQFASPDMTVRQVAKLMRDYDCGSIPVGEHNKLTGMITDHDIIVRCIAEDQDPMAMTASECMSPGILYCFETDDVEDVLKNMGKQAVKRLPVVDDYKALTGIVSLGDLSLATQNKACCGEAMEQIRSAE